MGGDRIPGPFNDAVDENERRRKELFDRHRGAFDKTPEELIEAAQAAYIKEFLALDEIALGVFHGKRGHFVRKYTDAWLAADPWNKRLMRPVFEALIRKYNLKADPTGAGPRPSEPRQDP